MTIRDRVEAEGGVTFAAVEERLLEAWGFLRRLPDREAGWVKVKALWPAMRRHSMFGDYGDMEPDAPRSLPGLTVAELRRMDEALLWIEQVAPRERKLIGLVLQRMDRERAARPHWIDAAHDWRRDTGEAVQPDTLRMRYGRALHAICVFVEGRKSAEMRA
ncbi:hypothetical protein GCM10022253_23930 [Sphingomonas endophytica]|nr:hypothetical protein [Sphingomonas endophytica]